MEDLIFETKIKLPRLFLDKKIIRGNKIIQLAQDEYVANVKIYAHTQTSFKLIDDIGRNIYLKLPNSKVDTKDKEYVLKANDISDISQLDESTKVKWDNHALLNATQNPDSISESWKDSFFFVEEDLENRIMGLRKPQIGALHAVSAHWSVRNECATIVMPTGTGKTEVMLSVLAMERCKKILIIIPTSPLRDQTFNKFIKFGCLQQIGILSNNIIFPRVAYVSHGIKTINDAKDILAQSNVIIATASALSKSDDTVLMELAKGSTHLFIDEAHHALAPTWGRIKEKFKEKPILQFTATPFRSDGKKIEGKIIYDYPLGLAQKNKYFKKIDLIKINELNDEIADREIAKRTVAVLESDLQQNLDHIVMVRADCVSRAEALLEVYKEVGNSYNPVLMHYGLKALEKNHIYDLLHSRGTRIIVCVNMLGEGYDLPNLKIAAIHDIHKNLTTTLQFIGRFTRTSVSDQIGDASVIVNVAEPNINKKLEQLYAENPDWNIILRQKSESAIAEEIKLQEVIQNFRGNLIEQISLWNLRPSFSSLVYKTNCETWLPQDFERVLNVKYKKWYSVNYTDKLLVFLINKEEEVNWGKYQDIKNLIFDLCVVYWDQDAQRLFIGCSNYDMLDCDRLAKIICGIETKIINGAGLFNLFSGINYPMVRNLGAKQIGSISFTMYFGPEVTKGLSAIDKADSIPNNIFAWGYEEGEMVTYGCSSGSGKVWSHGGGSIVEWKNWCLHVKDRVIDSDKIEEGMIPEIVKEFLRPVPLIGRYKSVAVAAEWGQKTFQAPENKVSVYFGEEEWPLFEVSLDIIKHSDSGPIYMSISHGNVSSEYELKFETETISEGINRSKCVCHLVGGPKIFIRRYSGDKLTFEQYTEKDPIIIRYADGSFSYGNYHVTTPAPTTRYNPDNLEAINWTADIHIESEGPDRDNNSIQYQIIESIKDDYDIVINDDDSYEAADIIALRRNIDSYTIHLIHCKFSHTKNPGGDIRNLYEVCGQAQKSIQWKHAGFDALVNHIKKREEKWKEKNHTRFIKGDLKELISFQRFARITKANYEITICQPGLSKARVTDDIVQLLACTENYLIKTSDASLQVICSN